MKKNKKLIGVLLVAVIVILLSSIMLIINKNSKKEVIEEVYARINPKINVSNIEYNMDSIFPGFEKEIIIYDDNIKSTFRPEEKVKAVRIEIYKNNEYANLRRDVINEMNNIINEEFSSSEYGYEFSAYIKSINCYEAITKGRVVIILNSQYHESLINNIELTDLNYIKGINVIEELPNKDKMLSDEVNNARTDLYNYKKAGLVRNLNKRPVVRGVAMNPIDHPHGGGEGKASGGRVSVTPWGFITKGRKTVKHKNHE